MTESSPVTHVTPLDPGRHRPGSIGPPVPNTECRIVDVASGTELGAGEEGEVCVRGPQVMRGYLDDPEATAATVDDDGWLHTGDIGRADDDGYVVLVDRVKELIKYKGYQVAPAELEAVLLEHPAVAEAAVVGRPDEEAGEVPKAFVARAGDATAQEIMTFVAERVAPYKRLRALEFVDEIPKSPSGKILRRLLNERERP
jgi:acyl-CoA synthetase (AMP-forming)/AMP-acid ligase II